MPASASRRFRDGFLSFGSFGTLLAVLAAINATFRNYLVAALHGQLPPWLLRLPYHRISEMTDSLPFEASPSQIALTVAGVVLTLLMFLL